MNIDNEIDILLNEVYLVEQILTDNKTYKWDSDKLLSELNEVAIKVKSDTDINSLEFEISTEGNLSLKAYGNKIKKQTLKFFDGIILDDRMSLSDDIEKAFKQIYLQFKKIYNKSKFKEVKVNDIIFSLHDLNLKYKL